MSRHPKNPKEPKQALTLRPTDIVPYDGPLWRIHNTGGLHPASWNELRRYGPLSQFRWEPHPPPPRLHADVGVAYTATDYATTFAEVFQADRAITLTASRALSGWVPVRPLRLLDLVGTGWALRQGASASLPGAAKHICRGWAQAIYAQLGQRIDGIICPSTMTGLSVVVLVAGAATAYPVAPAFSRPLTHQDVATLARKAADTFGWPIR